MTLASIRRLPRRAQNKAMALIEQRHCRRARPMLEAEYPRVAAYLSRQASEGGLMHFYSYAKLLELARTLDEVHPQLCLELGSGGTTAVFADHVERNATCEVISVDEEQRYMDATTARLAAVGLQGRVRPMICAPIVSEEGGRYDPQYLELVGDRQIDLLYVDGPSGGGGKSIDAVWLGDSGRFPRRILFDYRLAGVRAFQSRQWARLYSESLHFSAASGKAWIIGPWRHHSRFDLTHYSCARVS